MSDQMIGIGRTSLEQTYEELLKDLESLERDLYEGGLSEESLFIDNFILRLKVWASDINIQGGSLITIDKIGPLAMKIQSRLDDIKSLTKDAKTTLSQNWPLAENKNRFLDSLDSLAMLVEPIKTIGAQSSTDEKDHASRIDSFLKVSDSYKWARKYNWFVIKDPFERARFPALLGNVVTNPRSPIDSFVPLLSLTELGPCDSIRETVLRDFSISNSLSKSQRSYTSTFGVPEVHTRALTISVPEVHTRELVNPKQTFNIRPRAEVRKRLGVSKLSKIFLVIGVMSAMRLSMDQTKSKSSGYKLEAPPSGIGVGAEAGSCSRAEEHTTESSFQAGEEVIFAIKYKAFRFKLFSNKLKPVDFNPKQNGFSLF